MYNLTLQLNARLRPMDRGEFYEDPLLEILEEQNLGTISGGGTALNANREVACCDIEISLNRKEDWDKLVDILLDMGIPKGSFLRDEETDLPLGTLDGLALYLNGTQLPDEVYETCDINYAVEQLEQSLGSTGRFYSYWEGPQDTALYFYGPSFSEMNARMEPFLSSYPLCQKCRVEQIAG